MSVGISSNDYVIYNFVEPNVILQNLTQQT